MAFVHLLGNAFTLASWPSGNKLLSSVLNLYDDDDDDYNDDIGITIQDDDEWLT